MVGFFRVLILFCILSFAGSFTASVAQAGPLPKHVAGIYKRLLTICDGSTATNEISELWRETTKELENQKRIKSLVIVAVRALSFIFTKENEATLHTVGVSSGELVRLISVLEVSSTKDKNSNYLAIINLVNRAVPLYLEACLKTLPPSDFKVYQSYSQNLGAHSIALVMTTLLIADRLLTHEFERIDRIEFGRFAGVSPDDQKETENKTKSKLKGYYVEEVVMEAFFKINFLFFQSGQYILRYTHLQPSVHLNLSQMLKLASTLMFSSIHMNLQSKLSAGQEWLTRAVLSKEIESELLEWQHHPTASFSDVYFRVRAEKMTRSLAVRPELVGKTKAAIAARAFKMIDTAFAREIAHSEMAFAQELKMIAFLQGQSDFAGRMITVTDLFDRVNQRRYEDWLISQLEDSTPKDKKGSRRKSSSHSGSMRESSGTQSSTELESSFEGSAEFVSAEDDSVAVSSLPLSAQVTNLFALSRSPKRYRVAARVSRWGGPITLEKANQFVALPTVTESQLIEQMVNHLPSEVSKLLEGSEQLLKSYGVSYKFKSGTQTHYGKAFQARIIYRDPITGLAVDRTGLIKVAVNSDKHIYHVGFVPMTGSAIDLLNAHHPVPIESEPVESVKLDEASEGASEKVLEVTGEVWHGVSGYEVFVDSDTSVITWKYDAQGHRPAVTVEISPIV